MASNDPLIAPSGTPNPDSQSILATVASTAEQAITGNTDAGSIYEFVSAGSACVKFGLTGMGAATTADAMITTTPRRFYIHPKLVTHIRAIRNGAAGVIVSFQRVR